ncbi:hypothetical protein Btru_010348 [Bulinus truncatus]|nr:hypothetical protein Btru_010348 [Bulinus truncatus]
MVTKQTHHITSGDDRMDNLADNAHNINYNSVIEQLVRPEGCHQYETEQVKPEGCHQYETEQVKPEGCHQSDAEQVKPEGFLVSSSSVFFFFGEDEKVNKPSIFFFKAWIIIMLVKDVLFLIRVIVLSLPVPLTEIYRRQNKRDRLQVESVRVFRPGWTHKKDLNVFSKK